MTTLQDITAYFTSEELASDSKLLVALHEKMVSNIINVYTLLEGIEHIDYKDDVEVIFTARYLMTYIGDMKPDDDLQVALRTSFVKAVSFIKNNKHVHSVDYGYGPLLPDVDTPKEVVVKEVNTNEPKKRGRKSPLHNGKTYGQVVAEILEKHPDILPKEVKVIIADTLGVSKIYANTLYWNHFNKVKVSVADDDNLIETN